MEKYYISTAIAYTSGKPHIGNTYEVVLADVIARYKRLLGYDVYFQTGTDEHGIKIEEKAKAAGVEPQKFVDDISLEIRRIYDIMNTSYDKFVRTTNPNHESVVADIFKKLYICIWILFASNLLRISPVCRKYWCIIFCSSMFFSGFGFKVMMTS